MPCVQIYTHANAFHGEARNKIWLQFVSQDDIFFLQLIITSCFLFMELLLFCLPLPNCKSPLFLNICIGLDSSLERHTLQPLSCAPTRPCCPWDAQHTGPTGGSLGSPCACWSASSSVGVCISWS